MTHWSDGAVKAAEDVQPHSSWVQRWGGLVLLDAEPKCWTLHQCVISPWQIKTLWLSKISRALCKVCPFPVLPRIVVCYRGNSGRTVQTPSAQLRLRASWRPDRRHRTPRLILNLRVCLSVCLSVQSDGHTLWRRLTGNRGAGMVKINERMFYVWGSAWACSTSLNLTH